MVNLSYIILISILINSLVQVGIIFKYYFPLAIEFFKNKKISWNSNYDRIILAAFTVFFYLSFYFSQLLLNSSDEYYFIILYLIILTFMTVLIFLIHKIRVSERIKNSSIPLIKNHIKKNILKDFESSYSKIELENIFARLINNEYIDIINKDGDVLDKDLFVITLSEGTLPKVPIFKLNMNNIQYNNFHSLFTEKTNNLSVDKFLKIFINKNRKTSAGSISASVSKANKKNTEKKLKEMKQKIFVG